MIRLLPLLLWTLSAVASPDEDDEHRRWAPAGPPPRIVIDQTAAPGAGILANLRVDYAPACSKKDALERGLCDSVAIRGSDVQVLLPGPDGRLRSAVGLHNPEGVEAARAERAAGEALFGAATPIDLDALRTAADRLAPLSPGRTGTLGWHQFQANVRAGRPMYGIVRVLVPVGEDEEDDEDNHPRRHRSRGEDDEECEIDDWDEEHLGPGARIEVYGALLFDFVDCRSGRPLATDGVRGEKLKIPVPLLVNPVPMRPDGAPAGLDRLVARVEPGLCQPAPCTVDLDLAPPLAAVPPSRRRHWELATGAPLTPEAFAALPASARFHLITPDGYVDGWLTAFRALGLDQADWRALGFTTRDAAGPFDAAAILDEAFQDLPALAYTGGLIDIHHHVNISGLVYVPQALELEQKGWRPARAEREDEDDDHHGRMRARSREEDEEHCEDDEEHHDPGRRARSREDDEDHRPCPEARRIPSWQYIVGAILVRDGFYLEALRPGGITLLVNEPASYSQIRLTTASGQAAGFRPVTAAPAGAPASDDSGDADIPPPVPPAAGQERPSALEDALTAPPQWTEIRPLGP